MDQQSGGRAVAQPFVGGDGGTGVGGIFEEDVVARLRHRATEVVGVVKQGQGFGFVPRCGWIS